MRVPLVLLLLLLPFAHLAVADDSIYINALKTAWNPSGWKAPNECNSNVCNYPGVVTSTGIVPVKVAALQLYDAGITSYPSALWGLTNLIFLDLSYNSLPSFPTEMAALTKLNTLILSHNQMNGPLDGPTIGALTNLQYLMVAWNSLSGTLPSELFSLTDLKWLQLNQNLFGGSVDGNDFMNLTSLEQLRLTANLFTGPAPVITSSALTTCDISNNNWSPCVIGSVGVCSNSYCSQITDACGDNPPRGPGVTAECINGVSIITISAPVVYEYNFTFAPDGSVNVNLDPISGNLSQPGPAPIQVNGCVNAGGIVNITANLSSITHPTSIPIISTGCISGEFSGVDVTNTGTSSDCVTYTTTADYSHGLTVLVTPKDHCGKGSKTKRGKNKKNLRWIILGVVLGVILLAVLLVAIIAILHDRYKLFHTLFKVPLPKRVTIAESPYPNPPVRSSEGSTTYSLMPRDSDASGRQ